jgi:hypothetical protein
LDLGIFIFFYNFYYFVWIYIYISIFNIYRSNFVYYYVKN